MGNSTDFSLEECTIEQIHNAYKAETLNCVSLTQRYLDRIAAYDQQGPTLNSFVTLNPNALERAKEIDNAYARNKTFIGPLHGIPVAIKDQAEIAGLETSFGSIALKGYVPETDATIVKKLKQAGAVIIGKTTMPDFAASWWGFGSVHGETKCPYDLDRDSGGSSGGTGAAVAANLAAVGIGEDTGGSIRLPSSANNLVGIRVTPGMISRTGLSPLLVLLDTAGPMTRTVADAAILLDVLVGYDPSDEYTTTATIANHKGSYTECLQSGSLEGVRIGVLREAFGSDSDPECTKVNTVVRRAIDTMSEAGVEFVELSIPDLDDLIADTSLYISRSRHDLDRFFQSRPGLGYSSIEEIYRQGKYDKNLELIPAIVEDGPLHPENDPEYFRKLSRVYEFQRILVGLMAKNSLDGICYPVCRVLSPTHEELRSGRWTVLTYPTNTVISSQSLLPSICLPTGFSEEGVPVGMEITAPPYREPELIQLGYSFEQLTNWRQAPRATPPL